MHETRAGFVLQADETLAEEMQQALTCKVGDAEEHHPDDGVDVEAHLHRLESKSNAFRCKTTDGTLQFQTAQVATDHGTAMHAAACKRHRHDISYNAGSKSLW